MKGYNPYCRQIIHHMSEANSMPNSNEKEVCHFSDDKFFLENYRYSSTDEGVVLLALPENLEQLELVLLRLCVVLQLERLPHSPRHVHHSILGLSPFQWLIISKNSATDQQDNWHRHLINRYKHIFARQGTNLKDDEVISECMNVYCFQIIKLQALIFFDWKILNNKMLSD